MGLSSWLSGEIEIIPPIPVSEINPDSLSLPANNRRYHLPSADLVFHIETIDDIPVATLIVPAVDFGYKIGHPAGELEGILSAHGTGRTFEGGIEREDEYGGRIVITIEDGRVVSEEHDPEDDEENEEEDEEEDEDDIDSDE
jgi:hypothetical protein